MAGIRIFILLMISAFAFMALVKYIVGPICSFYARTTLIIFLILIINAIMVLVKVILAFVEFILWPVCCFVADKLKPAVEVVLER